MQSTLIIDDGLPSHTYLELLDDMKYSHILLNNRTSSKEQEWIFLKKTSDEVNESPNSATKISK